MAEFNLNERLERDTILIKDLKLSKLLLMNDSNFFWFILVPREANLKEFHDLSYDQQIILLKEINQISKIIEQRFNPDKINIAALGNVVSQLHIHVIARYKTDAAWPDPVWGKLKATKYQEAEISDIKQTLLADLAN